MSFLATWMDLEIVILNEVSQTEKDKYTISLNTWNLKIKCTNEFDYKTEIESQMQKTNFVVPGEKNKLGDWY